MSELHELWSKKEKLHPDLIEYLREGGTLGTLLQAPLVYQVPYEPMMNAYINKCYLTKKEIADDAYAKGHWERWLFMHERPWRMIRLMDLWRDRKLSPEQLKENLRWVWTDTEFPYQFPFVNLLFRAAGYVSDDELPPLAEFTVWRGANKPRHAVRGLSWTLDRKVAERFSKRFATPGKDLPTIATARVKRQQIAGYFTGRKEEEIIILPGVVIGKVVKK